MMEKTIKTTRQGSGGGEGVRKRGRGRGGAESA